MQWRFVPEKRCLAARKTAGIIPEIHAIRTKPHIYNKYNTFLSVWGDIFKNFSVFLRPVFDFENRAANDFIWPTGNCVKNGFFKGCISALAHCVRSQKIRRQRSPARGRRTATDFRPPETLDWAFRAVGNVPSAKALPLLTARAGDRCGRIFVRTDAEFLGFRFF